MSSNCLNLVESWSQHPEYSEVLISLGLNILHMIWQMTDSLPHNLWGLTITSCGIVKIPPRGRLLSRLWRPLWGPLAAILDVASGEQALPVPLSWYFFWFSPGYLPPNLLWVKAKIWHYVKYFKTFYHRCCISFEFSWERIINEIYTNKLDYRQKRYVIHSRRLC